MKRPQFFHDEGESGGAGGAPAAAPAAAAPTAAAAPVTLLGGAAAPAAPVEGGAAAAGGSPYINGDGSFAPGWLEKLSSDLRGNASLQVVPSLEALAKSYVETKTMVGRKLEMPGEGATPEAIASWRKTVGAPDKPEGYLGEAKTLRPDAIPENLWNADGEKKFLELAHKHHLTPGAVKEILAFHGESVRGEVEASAGREAATLQAETATLKQAWGQDFDANLNLASRVAQTVGLTKDHPIFTSAEVVKAFAKFGKLLSEDKLVKGDAGGISGSIQERAREITDPKATGALARDYRGENGPERQQAAQKQLHELYTAQNQK